MVRDRNPLGDLMARAKEEEQTYTFPLDLGIDNTALAQTVQPTGPQAALVGSVNTRLSKSRGAPSKAPGSEPIEEDVTGPCLGIVPAGNIDSSVAFFHPPTNTKRISGSVQADLSGTQYSLTTVTNYIPGQVTRAGQLPGGASYIAPAICYDALNSRTWVASVREYTATDSAIYISCFADDGRLLVAPYAVVVCEDDTSASAFTFVGLTYHGVVGVVLWYRDTESAATASTTIKARNLSLSGLTLTVGSAHTIYTPVTLNPGQAAVHADGGPSWAYLTTRHSATATTQCLHRVSVYDFSKTTVDIASFTVAGARLDVKEFLADDTHSYVAVCCGYDAAFGASLAVYNGLTMVQTWNATGVGAGSHAAYEVQCGFYIKGEDSYAVFACTDTAGSISSVTDGGTRIRFRSLAAGTVISTVTLPFMRPVTKAAHLKVSSTQVFPLFAMQRCYAWADSVTGEGYLTDPSVEVLIPETTSTASVVGRFGVDTAYRTYASAAVYSSGAVCQGSKYIMSYLEDTDNSSLLSSYPMRYVEVDFDAGQPRYALTAEGSALIAAAMPVQWDGVELSEFSPIHRPTMHVFTSGGSASALTTGTYKFSAVQLWRDNNGIIHRSMPAAVRTISGAGLQPRIQIAQPIAFRDGYRLEPLETIFYVSQVGGTVLYAQSSTIGSLSSDLFWDLYSSVAQPTATANNPPIYTDGDASMPLMAQCPPAAKDIAIVGSRAWLIEAERPWRAWPSKLREPYTAFEFSSDLVVSFPASTGDLMAVVEQNGNPVFLSKTGAWVVPGEGPDNTLQGQPFGAPVQISDLPCTDARSVIRTPVGVMYVSSARFVQLSEQPRIIENIDATLLGDCITATVLRDTSEVLFIGTSLTYVYNYALDRWSTWNSDAIPASDVACFVPTTKNILTYSDADSTLYLVDTDSVSTTAQMSWTTGDIQFGGPQDDFVVSDILIHGRREGSHGLTVALTPDYGQASTVTKTYSAAEVLAATVNSQYTLSCTMAAISCRALKVVVTETDASGEAARPTSVTIVVARNPGTKRDAVKASGRK